MRLRRALVPLLVLACLPACTKDSGGIDSGLPPSKAADELAPTEQTQLCEALRDYYLDNLGADEFRRFECTAMGIGVSLAGDQSVAACNEARDACIAMPDPDPIDPVDPDATCELGIDWATCNATVDQLEACFTEYTDQGSSALNSYSCSKMAQYVKTPPTFDESVLDPGPACQAAQADCPSLELGGGADAMNGA